MSACGCDSTQTIPTPAGACMQLGQMPYKTAIPIDVTAQDEQPPMLRAYQNCDPGYPSVFIDHWRREKTMVGDPTERWHNPPRPWTAPVIWEFFKNLPPG